MTIKKFIIAAVVWLSACGGTGSSPPITPPVIPPVSGPTQPTKFGVAVDSVANGYSYGYGPSIMYEDGQYHMWYCSTPSGGAEDFIRHSSSVTGNVGTWAAPDVALSPLNSSGAVSDDFSNCDPSVVFYNGYYYMFYGGDPAHSQGAGAIYVARSTSVLGPWNKWNGANWEYKAYHPKPIIQSFNPAQVSYGAGEPTAFIRPDGTIGLVYFDTNGPAGPLGHYLITSTDAINWTAPVALTGILDQGPDIKYSPADNKYYAVNIVNGISGYAQVFKLSSVDGINWTKDQLVNQVEGGTLQDGALEPGLAGDKQGHLITGISFYGFGADYIHSICGLPYGNCWGQWDINIQPFPQ